MASRIQTAADEDDDGVQMIPLVNPPSSSSSSNKDLLSTSTSPSLVKRFVVIVIVLMVLAGVILMINVEDEIDETEPEDVLKKSQQQQQQPDNDSTTGHPVTTFVPSKSPVTNSVPEDYVTTTSPTNNPRNPYDYFIQDEALELPPPPMSSQSKDPVSMRTAFEAAKTQLMDSMRVDYGQYLEDIFFINGTSMGRLIFVSPTSAGTDGLSWGRMKNKILIKLLRVLTANADTNMISFIWATGGHSAAAAHGDFVSESYTKVLERRLRPVFAAVNMHLVGRNFAMGGTGSALEVALCVDQIFGLDIDILSWDFGMTDGGRNHASSYVYFSHAALNPNRPACVAMFAGGKAASLIPMEQDGLTVWIVESAVERGLLNSFPDCETMSQEQVNQLPPLVRGYRCGGAYEGGDICRAMKWTNNSICTKRKFRTSWHPGFKWHALMGNLMALSLLEVLDDALRDLVSFDSGKFQRRLEELVAQETGDYARFAASHVPDYVGATVLPANGTEGLDFEFVCRTRPFCQTGRLPSRIRYEGILTETTTKLGEVNFEKGIPFSAAVKTPGEGDFMRLVYDAGERQNCEGLVQIDYKDFFYVNGKEGWKKLVLPNDAERAKYVTGAPLKGLIIIALGNCDWNKCNAAEIRDNGIEAGDVEIVVNGVKVSSLLTARIKRGENILRNENGFYFPPKDDGKFEIRVRVNATEKYIRFSSIIIF